MHFIMHIKVAAKLKILSTNLRQLTSHVALQDKKYSPTITL